MDGVGGPGQAEGTVPVHVDSEFVSRTEMCRGEGRGRQGHLVLAADTGISPVVG